MTTIGQSELPLVRHLDGISQLKRGSQDMKTAFDKEIEILSKISQFYPSLPYLQAQQTILEKVLCEFEEMWDRSFSEIYALNPESCSRIVQNVVARYEHNALRNPQDPLVVDSLSWL